MYKRQIQNLDFLGKSLRGRKRKSCDAVTSGSVPVTVGHNSAVNAPTRQAAIGKKQRKINNQLKNEHISILEESLSAALLEKTEQTKTIEKLQSELKNAKNEVQRLQNQAKGADAWVKPTLSYMSTASKKEFAVAVYTARNEVPPGTLYRLRQNTGINFNKRPLAHSPSDDSVRKSIEKFAYENSSEIPDMKAAKKDLRFYTNYKHVLWTQYKSISGSDISYSSFCSHWPSNVIKPKIEDYGTCKCQACENPALLLAGLKRANLVPNEHELDNIIRSALDGDTDEEESFLSTLDSMKENNQSFTFLEWAKQRKEGYSRDQISRVQRVMKANEAAAKLIVLYSDLKDHLKRNSVIKQTLKEKREAVMKSDDSAFVHIDWSENLSVKTPGEIQSAYFCDMNISLHCGYVYSKNNSGGFVSLSDQNCHKAEAIHAAVRPTLLSMIDSGIRKFVIASDSTCAQYRNAKNVFLTAQFCKENDVEVEWLFTESGHGKSSCDSIGGVIKSLVRDKVAFNTSTVIRNSFDIIQLVRDHTSVDLLSHTQEDIDRMSAILRPLGSLTGALRIHNLFFSKTGVVTAKDLPSDPVPRLINIKVNRTVIKIIEFLDPINTITFW